MTEELVTLETAQLAKEKGFDEECRSMWMYADNLPIEVNAPKDEELIGSFTAMFLKYRDDPAKLLEIITKAPKIRPLRNSTLPPPMYCRPTQDLLERWLREVHDIDVKTKCLAKAFIGRRGVYRATVTVLLKAYVDHTSNMETYELAREAALLHALKLLP